MMTFANTLRTALIATAATLAITGCDSMATKAPMAPMAPMAANTVSFVGTLSGAAEVPPKTTGGTGSVVATLNKDTSVLSWTITYSGLTGPATMAHFHGPALPGANAGVVVMFASPASPIVGQATLTAPQVADLMAGKWYANVHTAANPGGEIRAQVTAK